MASRPLPKGRGEARALLPNRTLVLALGGEFWSRWAMAETRHKCAIVTGAARGIGAGVARHLARDGWRIACVDIDGAGADAIAAETGGAAVQCDVGSEADVERLVTVARARLGRIDAIVSNAGVSGFAPLQD